MPARWLADEVALVMHGCTITIGLGLIRADRRDLVDLGGVDEVYPSKGMEVG